MNENWFTKLFVGDDNPRGWVHSAWLGTVRSLWELPSALLYQAIIPFFIILFTHLIILPVLGLRGRVSYLHDLDEALDEAEEDC